MLSCVMQVTKSRFLVNPLYLSFVELVLTIQNHIIIINCLRLSIGMQVLDCKKLFRNLRLPVVKSL